LDYGSLPPKERLSRFAEILHRGACRSQARRPNGIKYQAVDLTETEQKILQAIRSLESAAPEQLVSIVYVSRAGISRGLKVLLGRGLVVREGKTRRTRYSLTGKQKNKMFARHYDQLQAGEDRRNADE
jgi:DNA-binding MarR family transcriptional regulator